MIKTDYPKLQIKGNKRLIYVSGPYKAKTEEAKRENIWHAARVACRLWELGFFVICPHMNSANFEHFTDLDEDTWLQGSLEMLSRCDAIFFLGGWETSPGSIEEYNLAQKLEKDIYYEDTG